MINPQRVQRNYIHFTEKDGLTLQAVFAARYLTNRHVCDLFYSPSTYSWCKQRLRYLYDRGFLAYRQSAPDKPFVYYLALKGRRWMERHTSEWIREQIDRIAGVPAKEEETADLMLRHDLTLSDLYVAAQLQCHQHGWTLKWENARMLEIRRLGVQPDAYLRVEEEGLRRKAFVEFSSVLPSREEMRRKLAAYEPVIEHFKDAAVLWVTTSAAKRDTLYRWTAEWRYREWAVFGLIEDKDDFLTKVMWHHHGSEGMVRFIRPPTKGAGGRLLPDTPSLVYEGG